MHGQNVRDPDLSTRRSYNLSMPYRMYDQFLLSVNLNDYSLGYQLIQYPIGSEILGITRQHLLYKFSHHSIKEFECMTKLACSLDHLSPDKSQRLDNFVGVLAMQHNSAPLFPQAEVVQLSPQSPNCRLLVTDSLTPKTNEFRYSR